jgi:hypothetical protein
VRPPLHTHALFCSSGSSLSSQEAKRAAKKAKQREKERARKVAMASKREGKAESTEDEVHRAAKEVDEITKQCAAPHCNSREESMWTHRQTLPLAPSACCVGCAAHLRSARCRALTLSAWRRRRKAPRRMRRDSSTRRRWVVTTAAVVAALLPAFGTSCVDSRLTRGPGLPGGPASLRSRGLAHPGQLACPALEGFWASLDVRLAAACHAACHLLEPMKDGTVCAGFSTLAHRGRRLRRSESPQILQSGESASLRLRRRV